MRYFSLTLTFLLGSFIATAPMPPLNATDKFWKKDTNKIIDTKIDLPAAAQTIFDGVNRLRQWQRAPALATDHQLTTIAMSYARDLARRGELSHFDRDGNSLEQRLNTANFTDWREAGENLARRTFAGFMADDIVKSWNLSRPHFEAMVDKIYHRTGIGYALDADHEMIYWVQLFAD